MTGKDEAVLPAHCLTCSDLPAPAATNRPLTAVQCNLANPIALIAELISKTSRLKEPESQFCTVVATLEKLTLEDPTIPEFRSPLVRSSYSLDRLPCGMCSPKDSASLDCAAILIPPKLITENLAITELRSQLVTSYHNFGGLLVHPSRPRELESEHRPAIAIYDKLAVQNPVVRHRVAWAPPMLTTTSPT
jgi:hypothetical protein